MADLKELYTTWQTDPSPQNMHAVVGALRPTIDHAVVSVGGYSDPLLRNQARLYAAQAIQKYNPASEASIPTWVSRQLMQLRRFRRENNGPIRVPERVQNDAYHLSQKEQEFTDKFNREPDLVELADFAKLPVKRITKIRQAFRKVPSQEALPDAGAQETDFMPEAVDYVYGDADFIDRKILEMKTGYGGANDPLPPAEIAAKLKLTPSQLSRRAAKLSYRIQQTDSSLRKLQ